MTASSRAFAKVHRDNAVVVAAPAAAIISRARGPQRPRLLRLPSQLRALDRNTNTYSINIGDGLFTSDAICSGESIVTFVGEIRYEPEYIRRSQSVGGNYAISVRDEPPLLLDCCKHYIRGECLASAANSPLHCWNFATGALAEANARLGIPQWRGNTVTVSLIAKTYIEPNSEILYKYTNAGRTLFENM